MVHVRVDANGTEDSIADAIYRWAAKWPGDDLLVCSIGLDSSGTGGVVWPTRVASSIDALSALAPMLAEHTLSYDVQWRREDGGTGHGVAQHGGPQGGPSTYAARAAEPLTDRVRRRAGDAIARLADRILP